MRAHAYNGYYIIVNYCNTLPLEKNDGARTKENYGGRLTLLERLTGGASTVVELLVVATNGNSMISLSV